MKVGGMDLNNLPMTQLGQGGNSNDNAMAQIGMKLVDAILEGKSQEVLKGGGPGGGMGLKDMLELMKLFGMAGQPQTARDSGVADVMKMVVTLIEQNTKQTQEQMKMLMQELRPRKDKDSENPSGFQQLMEKIAIGVVSGSMNSDPKKKLQDDLKDLSELQQIMHSVSPKQQGLTFEQQLALEELKDRRAQRDNVLNFQLKKLEAQTKERLAEQDSEAKRTMEALKVAGNFFQTRREQRQGNGPSPDGDPGRTAAQTEAPDAGLIRLECPKCQYEMAVYDRRTIHFCPQCGTSFDDFGDDPATASDHDPGPSDSDGPLMSEGDESLMQEES